MLYSWPARSSLASIAPALAAVLAPNEIQATFFTGQPFTSSTLSNVKFKMVFTADGKMTREPVAKTGGVKREGTWKLTKDGFCTTWKGSNGQLLPHPDCRRQQVVGDEGNDRDRDLTKSKRIRAGAPRSESPRRPSGVRRQIVDRRMLARQRIGRVPARTAASRSAWSGRRA